MLIELPKRRASPMRTLSLATLAAVGGAMLLSGCASSAAVRAGAPASAASTTTYSDENQTKILGFVSQAAKLNDDPNPTGVSWVYATRAEVAKTLDFGIPADEAQHAEVLVIAHGDFKAELAHGPAGSKPPTGKVIELVYDTTTWQSTEFGLVDEAPDLTTLGTVYSDKS